MFVKLCTHCDTEKPVEAFFRHSKKHDGLQTFCKLCHKEYHRVSLLRTRYGMTPESFDALLDRQGGGCALCRAPNVDARGYLLHVDHDHATQGVRGLLCSPCNLMLGGIESFMTRFGVDMQVACQLIQEYIAAPQYFGKLTQT